MVSYVAYACLAEILQMFMYFNWNIKWKFGQNGKLYLLNYKIGLETFINTGR